MARTKDSRPTEQDRLNLIFDIAVAMNSSPTTSALLETILDKCIALTRATSGSVVLYNPKEEVLEIVAYRGLRPRVASATRLKLGEGVTGWVARHKRPLVVNDTTVEPKYVSVRGDILSEIAVPVVNGDRLIGVINMDSNRRNAFNEEHKEFLLKVADLAAQVFVKDEMKERLESKVGAQSVLISAFETIERTEDFEAAFQEVMETMAERLGVLRGMLALFEPGDPSTLKVRSGFRLSAEAMDKGIYKVGEGLVGTAVQEGRTIAVEDVSRDPRFLNRMRIRRGQRPVSFIAAPVRIDNRTLGVLAAERFYDSPERFQDAVDTLTLLASLLAYRIRNLQEARERTLRLVSENLELRKALGKEKNPVPIIGRHPSILKVLEQIELTANTAASVLITGPTGTGKELVARALHALSDRREGPFVSLNCSAVPETLLEAELFGAVKGAYTGSVADRKGVFELAHGGTLFLDEIGEMPVHLQAKLLRALEEREIRPLGGGRTVKVDIRVIAATNRDLAAMTAEGTFRSDLYFRLNVIHIRLPSLAERRDDIVLLTDHFIRKFNALYQKDIKGIDKETERLLLAYPWPGNIRELENALERAVILCRSDVIDPSLLPEQIRSHAAASSDQADLLRAWIRQAADQAAEGGVYDSVIGKAEKALLEEFLVRNDFNKSRTAAVLGINRNTLNEKVRKYGLA